MKSPSLNRVPLRSLFALEDLWSPVRYISVNFHRPVLCLRLHLLFGSLSLLRDLDLIYGLVAPAVLLKVATDETVLG